ncbi:MAG TPA: VOC family protein [Dehalococcoidia bacterium]|nr:VOC family protein [Dehalococcoidia bacterium]
MARPAANHMPTLYPGLSYRDAPAAIAWLERAFGFEELLLVPGPKGTVAHAELKLGNGVLMLGSLRDTDTGLRQRAPYVFVADADAHHARAAAAGAEITLPPHDNDYGGRGYAARDLEGNEWSFGSYRPAL